MGPLTIGPDPHKSTGPELSEYSFTAVADHPGPVVVCLFEVFFFYFLYLLEGIGKKVLFELHFLGKSHLQPCIDNLGAQEWVCNPAAHGNNIGVVDDFPAFSGEYTVGNGGVHAFELLSQPSGPVQNRASGFLSIQYRSR